MEGREGKAGEGKGKGGGGEGKGGGGEGKGPPTYIAVIRPLHVSEHAV